jgi:hypothetical protein
MRESNQAVATNVQMAQGMVQGYRDIIEQSERIRQMIEANAAAMEEVTRSHKEIQDGVAGVDRTIRTILEVSRDLREMTGSLAKTFSWFDEVLATGEFEEPIVSPEIQAQQREAAAELPQPAQMPELSETELSETELSGAELPEAESDAQQREFEEEVELVEALEEENQAAVDDLSLTEDLDELGVSVEPLELEQPLDKQPSAEESRSEQQPSEQNAYDLENVEELEAVEEEIEELEGVTSDSNPGGGSS